MKGSPLFRAEKKGWGGKGTLPSCLEYPPLITYRDKKKGRGKMGEVSTRPGQVRDWEREKSGGRGEEKEYEKEQAMEI